MMYKKRFKVLLMLTMVAGLWACTKKWDDHTAITDEAINNNVYEAIAKNSNLKTFTSYLVKTGFDKVISTSKVYTVWAPTDAALTSLDASIVNDDVKLKAFVANHIALLSYPNVTTAKRIQLLNSKYVVFGANKFDSANIVTANQYAANGLYHTIDKFIAPVDNCWEFIQKTTLANLNKTALLNLNYIAFDSTKATQIGVNPNTGAPIWDSTNGKVTRNRFLDLAENIADESKEYTVFLLNDAAFTTEHDKLKPWFVTTTTDSTNNLAAYHLVKDLAIPGLYTASQLPDTLVSKFGVKVPINKSAIVASIRTSNGIVHIMSGMNFTLANKFPPIIIQGERPNGFAADRSTFIFYRVRTNPTTGATFNDIIMQNYGFANYWVNYRVNNMPSMRYNAFWVAVNDVQSTPLWQQRLSIDSSNNATTFPYVTVAFNNYNEISLGQFRINNYRNLNLFVVGPATSSTTGGANSISLDYIKLVPAF